MIHNKYLFVHVLRKIININFLNNTGNINFFWYAITYILIIYTENTQLLKVKCSVNINTRSGAGHVSRSAAVDQIKITNLCQRCERHLVRNSWTVHSSGPEIIKHAWVRSHTPNRTPCSNLYLYSRYRGYKFCFLLILVLRMIKKGDFLSKPWSLLKVILKTFNPNKM